MPQSGPSAASPPLRLSTTQADGSSVGKEQRHHENLNEERSRQDDAERIWKREQQRLKEREAIQDKFATLFEPPTPRASPTLLSSSLLPPSSATDLPLFNYRQTNSSRISRLSSNSSPEFGSFVKATDDPLSFPFTHEHLGQNEASFKNRPSPSHLPSNKTLQFFDSFTHDAKQRSSAARCQVLDELLLHEDDPMWFALGVKDGASQAEPLEAASIQAVSTHERNVSDEVEKRTSSKSLLLDIDHEYFRSSVPSSHVSSRSFSPTRHRTPSHSSSIPLPVVAPTIACQLTTSFPTGHYDPLVDHIKPLMPSAKEEVGSLSQALGCESSSSLSSKLMSSLLQGVHSSSDLSAKSNNTRSSSKISSHGANASGSIAETDLPVLNDNDSMPPRPFRVPSTFSMSPALEERGAHFSVLKQRSHFAPAVVTHSTSPFASSFYNSPSGAPGFEGDRYDWDKGFSDELDSERKGKSFVSAEVHDSNGSDGKGVSSRISGSRGSWGAGFGFGFGQVRPGKSTSHTPSPPSSVQDDELDSHARDLKTILPPAQNMRSDTPDWEDHDNGHKTLISSSSSTDVGSVGGMGEIIERMTGTIELVGRKASSDSVLMPELAYMLRAHLPALSRLPHSWMLIYSLDQHGISLNTLYSRCEAHLSRKVAPGDLGINKGMLLAIKDGATEDEDRAVFGAWIAEGLKLNKGKGYSGGGESFLWKYVDGILKVFAATGRNNYVALCEPDYISFGGGDGHYGLYLDDTLFAGSSASCPTFDNEPLCTGHVLENLKTANFECVGLEVWGMA